jgi:acyl-CoA thioester hydrolase
MPDPICIESTVRWGDLDALNHVNNTVFFRFFEEARIALLDRVGLRAMRRATGTGPILAATSCQFRLPLTHPDTVTCHAGVTRIGTTSFTVEYVLKSDAHDGAVAATGDSVVVHYDYDVGQKSPLPEAVRAALMALPALG